MLFWVLIIAVVLCFVGYIIANFAYEGFFVLLPAFGYSVLAAVVGLVVFSVVVLLTPTNGVYTYEPQKLQALGTSSETGGSFFLGTGTVDEEVVVQYVLQDADGWSTIETQEVDDVKLLEGDFEPTFTKLTTTVDYWWLYHEPLGVGYKYEIRVPEGTIVQNYVVDVNK